MGLDQKALNFTAFVLLRGLDVMERELEGARGRQPGLKESELDRGRRGVQGEGGCGFHMMTVLLPTANVTRQYLQR